MKSNLPLGAELDSSAPFNEKPQGYRCPNCGCESIDLGCTNGECTSCHCIYYKWDFEQCYDDYHSWPEIVDN